jgi:ABC-type transporter Mla subunit MlaD
VSARHRLAGKNVRFGRLAIAAQGLVALIFALVLLHAGGVRLPVADGGRWHLQVEFRDAGGISSSQRVAVLVAGVPSGRVRSVRYSGGIAVADLELDPKARGVVRRNATVTIRPRSALNDQTVAITPGAAPAAALATGDRIRADRTQGPVALDRVVSVLDADTRAQVAILLDQLAVGMRGRAGPLREGVRRLAPLVDSATRVSGLLERRRALLVRLVDSVHRLAAVGALHRTALAETVRAGRRTLDATAENDAALASTVRELPPTLDALDSALARVQALSAPLVPALDRLGPAARALPAALASARRASPPLRGLLSDAVELERDGTAPARQLAAIAPQLAPTARLLRGPTAKVEPVVRAVNDRRDGIGLLGERFSGVLSTSDANGVILRGLGTFEPFDPANLGVPGASGAEKAAVAAKAVTALEGACKVNELACLVRFLVPGLPGSVRP